ncbi:hypothetical protein DIPPA_03027 [Diplonema papillatum]|nr:hypothetical protein DIPPA_03027 [Diplonema papillatum]
MLPDSTSEEEADVVAGKIDHLHLGYSYCRGETGIRVKASSYAEARRLLPELPAEIAYFSVAGVPCGTNAETLQRNLARLGWQVTPLFKMARTGRFAEWAVKAETLPGSFRCDLSNGLRISIKKIDRRPIQPSRHISSARLSSSYRFDPDIKRRDPLTSSPDPVRYAVFVERYGEGADTVWKLAGDESGDDMQEDESSGNPDGTPLAGGIQVDLLVSEKATVRPRESSPPARGGPATTSSSESSSPIRPPRLVADLEEQELKALVRNLVNEQTAAAPRSSSQNAPNQPPAQDAAAFKKFVSDLVQERLEKADKQSPAERPATLDAPQIAALVESTVGTRVEQKVEQAINGPLQEIFAQLKLTGDRMSSLAAQVNDVRAPPAGKGAGRGSKMGPSQTSEQSQTLVAAPPAEASLGLVPYSQNLVSTELRTQARSWSDSLLFACFNCRSYNAREGLVKGLAEITRGIQSLQPDVLLLQETWLSDISLPPHLDGYIAFRLDRGGIGGGLLTFVKSNLSATVIPGASVSNDPHTECLGVEIKRVGLPPLKVLNVYRPPGAHTRKTLNLSALKLREPAT